MRKGGRDRERKEETKYILKQAKPKALGHPKESQALGPLVSTASCDLEECNSSSGTESTAVTNKVLPLVFKN